MPAACLSHVQHSLLRASFVRPHLSLLKVNPRRTHLTLTPARMVTPEVVRDFGNYKLLQSFRVEYAPITISKWRSDKTGLSIVLAQHQSGLMRYVST